jgi:putative endonuclease
MNKLFGGFMPGILKRRKAAHLKLGEYGEKIAARSLVSEGMEIYFRNLRLEAAQIDLIARDGETFVIVEVKTLRARKDIEVDPAKQLHPAQMDRLLNAVSEFRRKYHAEQFQIRCDFVEVTMGRIFPEKVIRHENWFTHKSFRKKKSTPFSLKPLKS